jgi:signal transduction histidine kinase
VIRLLLPLIIILFAGEMNFSFAQPRPVITSFKVLGKERKLDPPATVKLSSGENSFSFDYTIPGTIHSPGTKYVYQLEGFDKNWVDAGNREYTNYTNLHGGNYTFKIKATTDGVHWSEINPPVTIHISASFYNTAWFIVLIVLIIVLITGLVIYFAHRTQLQRILMTQKVRNSIASDLHDDIGSSLSSIMLMSEMAGKQPQQAAGYLLQISENARSVIENMNDIVWAINPDNDTLAQIVVRMQSFAADLLDKKNISLQFEAPPEIETLKLGMKERRNFYLIFKETIHNTVKYASCNHVKVKIDISGNMITLKIEDNGKGFDAAKSYAGNGLRNLQKRAAEIEGDLELISSPGNGTTVLLRFKTTQTGS